MKRRFFIYYMILVVVGVLTTGFFTSRLAQNIYKNEVNQTLLNNASLIRLYISDGLSDGLTVDFNAMAKKMSSALHLANNGVRVTFIDYKGNILGESEADFHKMENHLNRKEIKEALQGKTGSDIRRSATLKVNFLYIAVPLKSAGVIIRVSVPLLQMEKIDNTIWLFTVAGVLAGLLLTVLLALRFASSVVTPVNEFISLSNEIYNGNYSKRINIKSRDELGQLAEIFNKMTSKLENTITEMQDKNIRVDSIINSMISGIIAVDSQYKIILVNSIACEMFGIINGPGVIGMNLVEVVRNHQIITFLQETMSRNISLVNDISYGNPTDKTYRMYTAPIKSLYTGVLNNGAIASIHDITNIRKLEQIKTEFVSNVTHELKTPLTSIRGFIETLRSGAINDPGIAGRFLEIIDIEAERLYILINDVLQLSEIETKQKDVNMDLYNLKQIVNEVFSILHVEAEKKGINLEEEIDNNIEILANRDRIKQMLINLVDNGIKYNQPDGNVRVRAYKDEGKIIIRVRDTGIGIATEHLSRIFERFYRVDKGRSRSMGGTGLGLSIVKHIVNLYSGDIRVQSEPGKGTEFIIQLPSPNV